MGEHSILDQNTKVQVVATPFDNAPYRKNGWKQIKQNPKTDT
jgi:hypothetical protein